MRLSDLMKNRDGVSGRPLDSAQGRPSQKPDEEKPPESRDSPAPPGGGPPRSDFAAQAPPKASDFATQATPEATPRRGRGRERGREASSDKPPGPSAPDQSGGRAGKSEKPQPDSGEERESLYESLPSAIYQAAEQLKIPVPQKKEVILRNARTSLSKIFAKAVDPAVEKESLWKITRNTANDLSILIALDSNFAQMIQRYNYTNTEEDLIYHSINTAVIATDLAKNIDKIEYSPQEIGAAALLHDLGIAALGLDLVSDKKDPDFKKHVAKSVEILEEMKVPEAIRTMVAQHHERIDGRGYPAGISGNELLVSSQILSLSEGFEGIMCGFYQDKQSQDAPQENYVQATLTEFHEAFDPDVLKTLISLRGFYPNDTMIELTNRSICRVIKQNEGFPLGPVVQVVMDSAGNHPENARIIDLRMNTTLSIIRSVSHNG